MVVLLMAFPTFSSGLMSGTFDKSTLPLVMPRSSCTIAWYVHCESRGVTGSFRLSKINSNGGTWVNLKSNNDCSAWIRCIISVPSFLAMPLIFSYRITGFFLRLNKTPRTPCIDLSRAVESHAFGPDPYNALEEAWLRENRQGNSGE